VKYVLLQFLCVFATLLQNYCCDVSNKSLWYFAIVVAHFFFSGDVSGELDFCHSIIFFCYDVFDKIFSGPRVFATIGLCLGAAFWHPSTFAPVIWTVHSGLGMCDQLLSLSTDASGNAV
jgi:hypothetical protein